MGILKRYQVADIPTDMVQLSVVEESSQKNSPPVALHAKIAAKKNKPALTIVDKIRAIENLALSLGWNTDQLWSEHQRIDYRGLIMYIKDDCSIDAVTRQFIAYSWINCHGTLQTHRFYNLRVDQPWLRIENQTNY